jgi:hypothetical protein
MGGFTNMLRTSFGSLYFFCHSGWPNASFTHPNISKAIKERIVNFTVCNFNMNDMRAPGFNKISIIFFRLKFYSLNNNFRGPNIPVSYLSKSGFSSPPQARSLPRSSFIQNSPITRLPTRTLIVLSPAFNCFVKSYT